MKLFAICLGVGVILLLKVMEFFSVIGMLCWINPVCSFKDCVCCACAPSVHLDAPSICCVCGCVCWKLFKRLKAGSQVFALRMLFLCVSLHTMWLAKSLHLLCILPFGIL